MLCPHCNEELLFDGELYDSIIELDGPELYEVSVTITLICKSCYEELGEYQFDIEQDITDFSADHDDENEHELSVEIGSESFESTITDGIVYLGVHATITVNCICGESASYQCSAHETATSIMKELE